MMTNFYNLTIRSAHRRIRFVGFPKEVLEPLAETAWCNGLPFVCETDKWYASSGEEAKLERLIVITGEGEDHEVQIFAFLANQDTSWTDAFQDSSFTCIPVHDWDSVKKACLEIYESGKPAPFTGF